MNKTTKRLEVRAEALRWAMSKDGGQRLEGMYSRVQVAVLYHNIMDADHGQALAIAVLMKGIDCFSGRTDFVRDREVVAAMREAVS